ncbi:MAG: sodium:proton exchanger [Erythrobacter sp.]|nr:sodium:proton exchanger [Erythrobacter sp.]NCQ65178.1 sodium:proton exchanger [Alphaproteobacteria bacterium]
MAGELEPTTALSDALVILGAAGIVIPLFARFRITPVIGFLLIGILVGPYGLGALTGEFRWLTAVTISEPDSLDIFAEFGIILLLFTIGLELSFNRLWQMRKLVFGLGALELLIIGSSIALLLAMMGQYWTGAMALGLALALSSTAIVLPISGTASPVGKAALSMLLFEDIAIVPIIFMLGALAPYAQADGLTGVWTTLWQGAVVIGVLLLAGRYVLPTLFAQAARTKSPEVFLAATLVVVIGASLATGVTGLSPIVGALIAGLLIAETDYHGEVEAIIEPFKGLALGIFLITIGMSIDLQVLGENLGIILTAVVLVHSFKALVTGLLLRMMGARRNTATETGILMSSPSETTLIVLSAASSAMLIQPGTVQFWQIVTAIGLTITPLLALVGRAVARRVDPVPDPARDVSAPVGRVIVVGGGRVGRLVADMLRVHDKPYIMIESDADLVQLDKREGYHAIFGNAARLETLRALRVEDASAIVLTMDAPVLAQQLVARLRKAYPELLIVARARDAGHAAALYQAGASHAVPETLESSLQLSEAVLVDIGVAMGPVIASIHEKRDEMRSQIQTEGALEHKPKLRTSVAATPAPGTAPAD